MLAILAAAATLAAPSGDAPKTVVYSAPPGRSCGYWKAQPTDTKSRAGSQRLGDLPTANHELTVLRTDENGCSVAVTVREKVSGDGRFAPNR